MQLSTIWSFEKKNSTIREAPWDLSMGWFNYFSKNQNLKSSTQWDLLTVTSHGRQFGSQRVIDLEKQIWRRHQLDPRKNRYEKIVLKRESRRRSRNSL